MGRRRVHQVQFSPRKADPFAMRTPRTFRRAAAVGVAATMLATAGCAGGDRSQRGLVIGKSTSTTDALPGPTIVEEPSTTTTAEASTTTAGRTGGGGTGRVVAPKTTGLPDGSPYGEAIPFTSSV